MEKKMEKNIRNVYPFVVNLWGCKLKEFESLEERLKKNFTVYKSFHTREKNFWKEFFGETFPEVENIAQSLSETEGIIIFLIPLDEKKNHSTLFHDAEKMIKNLNGIVYPQTYNDWCRICSSLLVIFANELVIFANEKGGENHE